MKLYNSLTRKIEDFEPINPPNVGVYACGPTVYAYVTIGNWRTYALGDLLARALRYLGYEPNYIMNITDVGHLTGDNLGDADMGEDRMEQAAKREKKTAWDIAKFYTDDFLAGYEKLNLFPPKKFTKATDHIQEQIDLIKKIETAGFVYKIADGIYFDVKNYEKAGNKYGELSTLDKIKEGARVETNPEKKDPRDFALWKFYLAAAKRQMEWDSPWGKGFPGWHIECSAMSMKYLGEQFDIHIGGEDLKSVHHPNEIAQSEAATDKKPFVKYWLHGAFLLADGGRMGKSLGNAYTLHDIKKKGLDPLSLKYFYLTGHYRKQLNFTWEALEAANNAYQKLKNHVVEILLTSDVNNPRYRMSGGAEKFKKDFLGAVSDDLQAPKALAILWEALKSDLQPSEKLDLLLDFDKVFGFGLDKIEAKQEIIPDEILKLVQEREEARKSEDFKKSDELRKIINKKGYDIKDTEKGSEISKK